MALAKSLQTFTSCDACCGGPLAAHHQSAAGTDCAANVLKVSNMAAVARADTLLSKRHAVLLLRWVLIVATSYLVVFSRPLAKNPVSTALFVAAYFATNIVLTHVLTRLRSQYVFDMCVVVLDIAMVSLGLALSGQSSTQFYVVYFLVIFLSALSERIELVVGAALLITVAHLYTEARFVGVTELLQPAYLLRIPFLFVVAMFFGNLVADARGQERAADEARARERRMEFLSGVTHDLKNPLGVVQLLAGLLLDGTAGPLNPEQTNLLRRIDASTRNVISLALNLIDAARIDAGRLDLQRRPVNLGDVVGDALALVRSASEIKGVALTATVEPDLPTVHIDPVQMERVVSNVVGNAVKFTPAGGTVSLTVHRADDHIVLAVRDDGPGISPAKLPTILEKYGRHWDAGRVEGSGLGLFIAKAVVEAHGGSLAINSAVGRGTTVEVLVPTMRPAQCSTPRRPARRRWWRRLEAPPESPSTTARRALQQPS
jgi:signal transduction histidine kinase